MFEGMIKPWQRFLRDYLSYSPETHRRVEEEYANWDGIDDEVIDQKVDTILAGAARIEPETQSTIAIGWFHSAPKWRWVAAKQRAPLPPGFAGMPPPPIKKFEHLYDAHEVLMDKDRSWYMADAVSVHAEVMIIRVWLNALEAKTDAGLKRLHDAVIVASQPACWCCAALMEHYKIAFDPTPGNKPRTGWRHPLNAKSIPNWDLPKNFKDYDANWLSKAASATRH